MILIMRIECRPAARARVTSIALVCVLAAVAACSGSAPPPADGSAPACPVTPVAAVASIEQWGRLTSALAGRCARVATVVAGATGDPHDYEPTPSDIQALVTAKVVVVNGLGYDEWAAKAVASAHDVAVVDAGQVVGLADGANPHLWYSPAYVSQTADAITARLAAVLGPAAATYLTDRRAAWSAATEPLAQRIAALHERLGGRRYAATESVYRYTLDAVGLADVTPDGYRRAAANESEPAPADVQAFDALLRARGVDVLVYNTQTQGATPEQLRRTAEAAGIPVLDVTETLPGSARGSLVAWQLGQLDLLAASLDHS